MTGIPNRMEKMGFAESYAAIQKKRIVCPRGFLGDRQTSRVGESIEFRN